MLASWLSAIQLWSRPSPVWWRSAAGAPGHRPVGRRRSLLGHHPGIFPREWDACAAAVPAAERSGDLSAAYARLLADPNPRRREDASRAWCTWEDTHVSLMPGWTPNPRFEDPAFRMVFARLVTHYWSHGCFLADGQILAAPWALHRAWPGSRLVVVDDAGHGGGSFTSELITALNSVRTLT
jgi:proline iminopeptidase